MFLCRRCPQKVNLSIPQPPNHLKETQVNSRARSELELYNPTPSPLISAHTGTHTSTETRILRDAVHAWVSRAHRHRGRLLCTRVQHFHAYAPDSSPKLTHKPKPASRGHAPVPQPFEHTGCVWSPCPAPSHLLTPNPRVYPPPWS